MASPGRLIALALCASLALWGLALGAESQKEFVVESDLQAQDRLASEGASGNLIVLTGLLVGLGVGVGVALLSRLPPQQRVVPAVAVGVAVYVAVLLAQTMWPFYVAVIESRTASLSNTLLTANLHAAPSILLAPFCFLLGAFLVAAGAVRRLLSNSATLAAPDRLMRNQAAAVMLAAPFLAIAAWGNIRLLVALPDNQPGVGPYLAVLPALGLVCLGLIAVGVAKLWHLGCYVRNARLSGAVKETWQTLGRAEASLAAILVSLALAASFLPRTELPDVELGSVLVLNLRVHTQLLALLLIPLAPGLRLHAWIAGKLQGQAVHAATLEDGTHPLAYTTLFAAAATTVLAGIAMFAAQAALWAWILALIPPVLVATLRLGARSGAGPVLLLAFALWSVGNTVQASYAGFEGTSMLAFHTSPGLLALWRALAIALAAVAVSRLARRLGTERIRNWPLAAGAGAAVGAVILLEMPLTAWLLNRPGADAIAVGSVVASLDAPVRITLHLVALVLAVGAALFVARLHRPDWFARPPQRPFAAPMRVKAPA